MWYFSWILGTTMAVLLAVVNALWLENQYAGTESAPQEPASPDDPRQ